MDQWVSPCGVTVSSVAMNWLAHKTHADTLTRSRFEPNDWKLILTADQTDGRSDWPSPHHSNALLEWLSLNVIGIFFANRQLQMLRFHFHL